jgi:hypothetical protein
MRRTRTFRPVVRLEDRLAPSAAVVDRGDFYRADGLPVELLERAGQVVVRRVDGAGPLAGLRVVEQLAADLQILEYAAGPREDPREATPAAERPGVVWTAPVFQVGATGGWVVPTDEVVVRLRPGVGSDELFGDPRFIHVRPLTGTPDQFIAGVAAGPGRASLALAEELSADPRVVWATPNLFMGSHLFTLDPLYADQWHLNNTGQSGGTPGADVDAPGAWQITAGSPSIVIADIDDAIQRSHPDLAPNVWVNPLEIPGNGIDDDGNGWVDDDRGWDFWDNDNDPSPNPGSHDHHGTATAGIAVAAGNNNLGGAGIAYGAKLMPIRSNIVPALSPPDVATAVYYAAGRTADGLGTWRGADVLTCSWGFDAPFQPLTDAFAWAGVNGRGGKGLPSFCASGNDGSATLFYPSSLAGSVPGVIAVGGSTHNDVRTSYSQYGADLDFVAPTSGQGAGIVTTDRTGPAGYSSGDYTGSFGGTSAATPLAAGIGALALSLDANLTAEQVRGLLRNTTDLIGGVGYGPDGRHIEYGSGRVNAATAVRGVGTRRVQVLDGSNPVGNGSGIVDLAATTAAPSTRTLRIRNQGTQDLTLANLSVGAGPFSVVAGFSDATLSVGESATLTVQFAPNAGGVFDVPLQFDSNDPTQPSVAFTLRGTATDVTPPTVLAVVVNDGSPQRSRVTQLTVTFSELVNLPASPAAAFSVVGPSGAVATGTSTAIVNGRTQVTLSFSGVGTEGGSLADGSHVLTVLAGQVTDLAGLLLDGNGNGVGGDSYTTTVGRLFGDADGDGDVDAADFGAFRSAFGTTTFAFDNDADGDVDAADFGQFRQRFGTSLP